jgi:bifunctional UDP-N-acetylglucosamine pyrophosphorylase/glucosamine-1-phosphate N-acetyltransferase
MSDLAAIVLAAGQGTRMKSAHPKVLFTIAGRPLVYYAVAAAIEAGAQRVVVVASPGAADALGDELVSRFGADRMALAVQDPPRGTGDAARVGLAGVQADRVLIVYGDTPLLVAEELRSLVGHQTDLALLTCDLDDPTGYGRILRDASGNVIEVREHRDLTTDAQRSVKEVNAGVYAANVSFLRGALDALEPNNAQGELYLTDVVAAAARGGTIRAVRGGSHNLVGVNDRAQLAAAEDLLYRRIADRHSRAGVTVRSGARIEDAVCIEPDAVVEAGVTLRGTTRVARGAVIDVGCVVTDSQIGVEAWLKPYSVVTGTQVADRARIGPLDHLESGG